LMSALPPKADIPSCPDHVRLVPIADIRRHADQVCSPKTDLSDPGPNMVGRAKQRSQGHRKQRSYQAGRIGEIFGSSHRRKGTTSGTALQPGCAIILAREHTSAFCFHGLSTAGRCCRKSPWSVLVRSYRLEYPP